MQFIVAVTILGLASAALPPRAQHRQSLLSGTSSLKSTHIINSELQRNESECVKVAKNFIPAKGCGKDKAIEAAQDYCALKFDANSSYACPKFVEFLQGAFTDFTSQHMLGKTVEDPITPVRFCRWTEDHNANLQNQASAVPGIAAGSLEKLKIEKTCPSKLKRAMAPKKYLGTSEVPDFWYTYCLNQDCAHYLQSRHRWCKTNVAPSPVHSHTICMQLRTFSKEHVSDKGGIFGIVDGQVKPENMCEMYKEFMEKELHEYQAYQFVMHGLSKDEIPVPSNTEKALIHARLVNTAGGHRIRDNAAKPVFDVEKDGAAGAGLSMVSVLLAAVVASRG